jgi:hypothetical protein
MPSEELKKIEAEIAFVHAAMVALEVSHAAGKERVAKLAPLWSKLRTLKLQAKDLKAGKTKQTTHPGSSPSSGSPEVSAVPGAPGCGLG